MAKYANLDSYHSTVSVAIEISGQSGVKLMCCFLRSFLSQDKVKNQGGTPCISAAASLSGGPKRERSVSTWICWRSLCVIVHMCEYLYSLVSY